MIRPREWVALRLVPDRLTDNAGVHAFARGMWSLYSRPLARLQDRGEEITYRLPDRFAWEIHMSDQVHWVLAVPPMWEGYAREQVAAPWPRVTMADDAPSTDWLTSGEVDVYCLRLKRHWFWSLRVDRRTIAPLPALCQIAQDLRAGACHSPDPRPAAR